MSLILPVMYSKFFWSYSIDLFLIVLTFSPLSEFILVRFWFVNSNSWSLNLAIYRYLEMS